MDALLLIASTDRPVRFLMFKDIYEQAWMKPFARILGVIPVSSEQRPRELIHSLQTASDAIRNGEVVCIFAEGQITRIGQLLPFRRGFERIMKDVAAPIIPVALDGVLGSPSAFSKGRFVWKLPARLPHPVTVSFGQPLPPPRRPFTVRSGGAGIAGRRLAASARPDATAAPSPSSARRGAIRAVSPWPTRKHARVTFGAALVRSVFLARRLKKIWAGQTMVGMLLPPSVPGALVNYAALLLGKVPVNLNYTVSAESLASCVRQCGLKTVVTAKVFLEKLKLQIALRNRLAGGSVGPTSGTEGEERSAAAGSAPGSVPDHAC